MRDAMPPRYHRIVFDHLEEAAAFVAALSRYLASPMGLAGASGAARDEVWANISESDPRVTIYLSDGALAATARGFAPPPLAGQATAETVLTTCALILAAGETTSFGRDEILLRLTNRCA